MTANQPRTREEVLHDSFDREAVEERFDDLADTDGRAERTLLNLRCGWNYACRWFAGQRPPLSLPATTQDVLRFLTAHEHDAHVTARHRVYAVCWGHRKYFGTDPCHNGDVASWLEGHAHLYGTMSTPVSAATRDVLVLLVRACDNEAAGGEFVRARARSLLTLSYVGTMRGGEACSVCAETLVFRAEALHGLTLSQTKTSKVPVPVHIEIPPEPTLDPLPALMSYLRAGWDLGVDLRRGHLYRPLVWSDHVMRPVRDIPLAVPDYRRDIKRLAVVAGLDAEGYRLAVNSCRRGWAMDAANDRRSPEEIMKKGRWEQPNSVRPYIDAANIFRADLQVDY